MQKPYDSVKQLDSVIDEIRAAQSRASTIENFLSYGATLDRLYGLRRKMSAVVSAESARLQFWATDRRNAKRAEKQAIKAIARTLSFKGFEAYARAHTLGCEGVRVVPYAFDCQFIGRTHRLSPRGRQWYEAGGKNGAFEGHMPARYWVGKARGDIATILGGGLSDSGRFQKRQNAKACMGWARIAKYGKVYEFRYAKRFVGTITAMSREAAFDFALRRAEFSFSPTAPIDQVRANIEIRDREVKLV